MKKNACNKKGISLIEVVIALFVFGIGILGILRLITQNIAIVDELQIKNQAVLLAKQGIDMVIHLRNTNLKKSQPWNCINLTSEGICDQYFVLSGNASWYSIDMNNSGVILKNGKITGDQFDLLFSGYNLGGSGLFGPGSGFIFPFMARYLVMKSIFSGEKTHDNHIIHIESHVLYKKGQKTGSVMLETFLGDGM